MIEIQSRDLENCRHNSGCHGTVYQINDEIAYKIYHEQIFDYDGNRCPNPALINPDKRLDRLKRNGKDLQYSDVWIDKISMNHQFRGLVIPYYNEKSLFEKVDQDYATKIRLAKETVRNTRELTDHFIYPTDLKIFNIMVHNGSVKIADLDDTYTKVLTRSSSILEKQVVLRLNETLLDFFQEYEFASYALYFDSLLQRERSYAEDSYDFTKRYLDEKEKEMHFLIIYPESDIQLIKRALASCPYQVILVYDYFFRDDDYLISLYHSFLEHGIILYDAVYIGCLEDYLHNFHVSSRKEVYQKV